MKWRIPRATVDAFRRVTECKNYQSIEFGLIDGDTFKCAAEELFIVSRPETIVSMSRCLIISVKPMGRKNSGKNRFDGTVIVLLVRVRQSSATKTTYADNIFGVCPSVSLLVVNVELEGQIVLRSLQKGFRVAFSSRGC